MTKKGNRNTLMLGLILASSTLSLTVDPASAELRGDNLTCQTITGSPGINCAPGVPGRQCTINGVAGICRNVPILNTSISDCVCVPTTGDLPEEVEGAANTSTNIGMSCEETAVFVLDETQPISVHASLPIAFGGGLAVLTNFSGTFGVSTSPVAGNPGLCNIAIENGTFLAPSFDLADGTPTGSNTFEFGPSAQSSGTVDLQTGEFTAEATGVITNDLFPEISTRGRYRGTVDFAARTVIFDSTTLDRLPSQTIPTLDEIGVVVLTILLACAAIISKRYFRQQRKEEV